MTDAERVALRQLAVEAVDRWVTVHCTPDQIVLTHGAMLNLANVITDTLAAALQARDEEIGRLVNAAENWKRDAIRAAEVAEKYMAERDQLAKRVKELEAAHDYARCMVRDCPACVEFIGHRLDQGWSLYLSRWSADAGGQARGDLTP